MDKTTSLLAALDAHKLPSTAQLDSFLTFLGEFLASTSESATSTAASQLTSSTTSVDDRDRVAIDRVGGIDGSGGIRFGDESFSPREGIAGVEPSAVEANQIKKREAQRLSEGGERLARDIRTVMDAYRQLLNNKNRTSLSISRVFI